MGRRHRVATVLAAVLALLGVPLTASPVSAVPLGEAAWGKPHLFDPTTGGLSGLSCPSATFCVALDLNGNAFTFDGTRWSRPRHIDPTGFPAAVDCLSDTFCLAVDRAGRALLFDGDRWIATDRVSGRQPGGRSRASRRPSAWRSTFSNRAYTFDGTTWSAGARPSTPRGGAVGPRGHLYQPGWVFVLLRGGRPRRPGDPVCPRYVASAGADRPRGPGLTGVSCLDHPVPRHRPRRERGRAAAPARRVGHPTGGRHLPQHTCRWTARVASFCVITDNSAGHVVMFDGTHWSSSPNR